MDYIGLSKDGTLSKLIDIKLEKGAPIDGMSNIIDFSYVYERRMVILKNDGTVWAWGNNNLGQLGNGNYEYGKVPVQVKNLNDVITVSANYDFNLALKKDGTVWFWGFKGWIDEEPVGLHTPEKIENLNNVSLIYVGGTCLVMKKDGSYWTFEFNKRIPEKVSFN